MNVATAVRAGAATQEKYAIRRVEGLDDYRACEELQDRIWGKGDIAGVPLLDLLTAQENGGMVLGAFDPSGTLLGFVYSMLGLTEARRLKQCSVLLAVDPDHQGLGLGYRLKLAQRSAAVAQDIDLITWTFDPLLSRNAHLNIAKLGGVSTSYLVDVYGTGAGLNAGLETDRLFVEWHLSAPPRRPGILELSQPRPVNAVRIEDGGLPCCASIDVACLDPVVAVRIPPDIGGLKSADLELAIDWRRQTRELFMHYFGLGYQICDFAYDRDSIGSFPQYVLAHTTALEDRP